MARQSQIIWQYWIFLISTRRSTFEFPKLLSQCKFQLESRKDKNIHWSHVSLCEDVSVEGVYTSLSIYIIMYTHIKTKHVTFELHSYIGPCPPEEVPTGILLPLHLKIDSSLKISSSADGVWQTHCTKISPDTCWLPFWISFWEVPKFFSTILLEFCLVEEFTLHTSEGHLAHLGHVYQQTGGSQCQLGGRWVILIRVTTAPLSGFVQAWGW